MEVSNIVRTFQFAMLILSFGLNNPIVDLLAFLVGLSLGDVKISSMRSGLVFRPVSICSSVEVSVTSLFLQGEEVNLTPNHHSVGPGLLSGFSFP